MGIAHHNDARPGAGGERCCGLDGDLRPDAVRIADRQRNGPRPRRCHSGSANRVSNRELSQTTMRSAIFAELPLSLNLSRYRPVAYTSVTPSCMIRTTKKEVSLRTSSPLCDEIHGRPRKCR